LITTVFANWRVSLKTGGVGKDGGEKQRGGKFSTKKVVHFSVSPLSLFFFLLFLVFLLHVIDTPLSEPSLII